MQNDDHSQSLPFDTTITSKLNFAMFLKKHHRRNDNRIDQNRMCRIRIVPSLYPTLANEREVRARDW